MLCRAHPGDRVVSTPAVLVEGVHVRFGGVHARPQRVVGRRAAVAMWGIVAATPRVVDEQAATQAATSVEATIASRSAWPGCGTSSLLGTRRSRSIARSM